MQIFGNENNYAQFSAGRLRETTTNTKTIGRKHRATNDGRKQTNANEGKRKETPRQVLLVCLLVYQFGLVAGVLLAALAALDAQLILRQPGQKLVALQLLLLLLRQRRHRDNVRATGAKAVLTGCVRGVRVRRVSSRSGRRRRGTGGGGGDQLLLLSGCNGRCYCGRLSLSGGHRGQSG